MLFLDPEKPIATCESATCKDCPAGEAIHCHFSLNDWIHFLLLALPPFLLGGAGIYRVSGWMLWPWLAFAAAFFGFIEIRVMCSHCPHYFESGTTLKCWANYGSPKIWKYRPGPMTTLEKTIFLGSLWIIWGYPLVVLAATLQLFLWVVYAMTTGAFFVTLRRYLCSRCMNFACPLNTVKKDHRHQFFKNNPTVAKAWKNVGL